MACCHGAGCWLCDGCIQHLKSVGTYSVIISNFCNIVTNPPLKHSTSPPLPQGIQGEFNSPDQESLVHWINETTPPSAIFAGAMPTMATIKLTTHRPIVNHPHYEDAKLR